MDLGNPVEIVVHHLLVGGMACLGHQDRFSMLSAQVYMMHTRQDLRSIKTQGYQLS